jgi:pimeloyl-ACP methyl ester carboxylesterase
LTLAPTIPTHCAPEGLPIPTSANPVPGINAGTTTLTNPAGKKRGTVVLLHGLGQTQLAWSMTAPFSTLAAALVADGWQTLAIPYPADASSLPPPPQNAALNGDFAGDPLTPIGTRYLDRFLAEWDHVKLYLESVNGSLLPTWVLGFSLGGWSALQLLINRGSDLVAMCAMAPVTQMSYVYDPLASAIDPTFAALYSAGAALVAAGDVAPSSLNGLGVPIWLGYGTGVEVTSITGWRASGAAGSPGEPFDGVSDKIITPVFLGGPNVPNLSGVPKLSPTRLPVAAVPWALVNGQDVALYHSAGVLDADFVVNGDQSLALVAANGYVLVVRQQCQNTGPSAGVINEPTGVAPITFVPLVSYTGPDLDDGDQVMCFHTSIRTQVVTAAGNQTAAAINLAAGITVDVFTPNTSFNAPDYVIAQSGYTTADLLVPDFTGSDSFGGAAIVDTTTATGQPINLQAGEQVAFNNPDFIPAALTIARAYPAAGCQLFTTGDQFVGWARTQALAATAAANLAAGGSVANHPYPGQNHVLTAGNIADITAWVTATLDPAYPKVF